ncbi:MAG: hypothetical protein NZ919_03850 [Candidatus Caldarchaeum sp.]|nr:hypothetical protein [Candidatus Caldarchaeum sp.]
MSESILGIVENMMGRVFILTSILATALLLSVVTPTALSQAPYKGPWVDEVVIFVEQDQAKAVDML